MYFKKSLFIFVGPGIKLSGGDHFDNLIPGPVSSSLFFDHAARLQPLLWSPSEMYSSTRLQILHTHTHTIILKEKEFKIVPFRAQVSNY